MADLRKGRFKWLLETMCEKAEIDIQEIDPSLEYFEAKEEIEKRLHVRLRLKPELEMKVK